MIGLNYFTHSSAFPSSTEPEWSARVERWYQLDGAAFILPETYWQNRVQIEQIAQFQAKPAWMLLASPGASNLTDSQFIQSASQSPAKFVHTLPNIRSASLLAVMGWSGRVLCLQKDPQTIISALYEGIHLFKTEQAPIWIASVTFEGGEFKGHILLLGPEGKFKICKSTMANSLSHDRDLCQWLNSSEQQVRPFIADLFEIINSPG